MAQKLTSHRKTASSFINEPSSNNLMQFSPRVETVQLEQRSQFTTTNSVSKTNFIGDADILPEVSRAVIFTKTGEKHSLDDSVAKTTFNSFTSHSPNFKETQLEQSTSHLLLSESEKLTKNQGGLKESRTKLTKKAKNPWRSLTQKHRLGCTSRSVDKKSLSTCRLSENLKSSQLVKTQLPHPIPIAKNSSTETQTDYSIQVPSRAHVSSSSCIPSTETQTDYSVQVPSRAHVPPPSCIPRKYSSATTESTMKMPMQKHELLLNSLPKSPHCQCLTPTTPLKIYTKTNPNLKRYSELRGIASALTLITVISWLFSIFFQSESLLDYFEHFVENIQNWFLTKEKPKTKAELVVKFVQDLCS